MPTTLVPTIHERLAQCNTSIYLDGLVPGADVNVSVDGVIHNLVANSGSFHLTVPSLNGGDKVSAQQDAGSGFTPWSPEVEVEDVILPPITSPILPDEVGTCGQCVHVSGLVPGSKIDLFLGVQNVVGSGTAGRDGTACVGVDLAALHGEGVGVLAARMTVCGQQSPVSGAPVVNRTSLPKPTIKGPLFGCQRVIPTHNLEPGARVRYEMNSTDLGSFCSCWGAANVWVGTDLVTGQQVRAIPYYDSDTCKDEGPPSEWEPVQQPDERIKPIVQPALVDGDRTIRIGNQVGGATLHIRIRPTETEPYEEFGPTLASQESERDLNAPLRAGNVVTVVQTLCAVRVESDPVTVLPAPPIVLPPVVLAPLHVCGRAVQVSNLHQGAFVRVYANGIPIGARWAGNATSISVPVNLAEHTQITATQTVGGKLSDHSNPAVEVRPARVEAPRILTPVTLGDTEIWVSHVTPGARVSIWTANTLLGQVDAAEPVVRVSTTPVKGPVHPTAKLCDQIATGERVMPIDDPCSHGIYFLTRQEFKQYANFDVPATADGNPFTSPIQGQLYYPSNDGIGWPQGSSGMPLVVIAHGWWPDGLDSYLGYDYLAMHLARWGMVVFSLNMDAVNIHSATQNQKPHQFARGEIILHAVDELASESALEGRVDFSRIGLIGHSMGGEGVTLAQHINDDENRGYGIKGVVSIAPTNWRPEIRLRNVPYLQLLGSMDLLSQALLGTNAFNGFDLYDRAWRPKTHAWIHGARHNPFNRQWVLSGDFGETNVADVALSGSDHEQIATCLINAFFQQALMNRPEYRGYLQGTILPPSLRHLQIHLQHGTLARTVVDNYGDADEQEFLADEPLDKTENVLNLPANGTGNGLVVWEDVAHEAISAPTPHHTKGVELAWEPPQAPDAMYTTDTGSLPAAPGDVISLRIGQHYEDAQLNPEDLPADVFVTLDDGDHFATVRAGVVADIPYPDVRAGAAGLCPMKTIRIPVDAFTAANPLFDRTNISQVTVNLSARPTGHVLADDIEISS